MRGRNGLTAALFGGLVWLFSWLGVWPLADIHPIVAQGIALFALLGVATVIARFMIVVWIMAEMIPGDAPLSAAPPSNG